MVIIPVIMVLIMVIIMVIIMIIIVIIMVIIMLNNFCFHVNAQKCQVVGLSFGNKKPANVDRDYIVLLSNLIEEGTVQCIVEKLDLATLLVRTGTP